LQQYNKTTPQIIFQFAVQIEIVPLTGTTNLQHMSKYLDSKDFELTLKEIECIELGKKLIK
jgi:diketogulonate reductase-like aldo/keto reductase